MESIKQVYDGIEIEYRERTNDWRFELRGRERIAESLAKAKEAIDKVPATKKSFDRTNAYRRVGRIFGGDSFALVEVTSVADTGYLGRQNVWISIEGKREKVPLDSLYAVTPENEILIREIKAMEDQSETLRKKINQKEGELKKKEIEIPE